MSAPTRTAPTPRTAPAEPGRRRPSVGRGRSIAVQRAYARRAQRTGRVLVGRAAPADGRTRFVVLMMLLLATALVATLWLSTAAVADSYRLEEANEQTTGLSERAEELGREVASLETAPELARRARELGLVPAGDPARLVVQPDGRVVVVGEPRPAEPAAPPPPPAEPADRSPQQQDPAPPVDQAPQQQNPAPPADRAPPPREAAAPPAGGAPPPAAPDAQGGR